MLGLRFEVDGEPLFGGLPRMKGFLFDQNLPSRLRFEPSLPLVPLTDLGPNPTDTQVWDFARQRRLLVVSKDADFSERIIVRKLPMVYRAKTVTEFTSGPFAGGSQLLPT